MCGRKRRKSQVRRTKLGKRWRRQLRKFGGTNDEIRTERSVRRVIAGISGNTGDSTGPHLHFGIQDSSGSFVDPTQYGEELAAISGDVPESVIMSVVSSVDSQGFGGWILDKYNNFADGAINAEMEWVLKPIGHFIKFLTLEMWEWFVANLPEIMGYTTMAAGVFVILSAMVGKGGMVKTLAWYFGFFILGVCILAGQ